MATNSISSPPPPARRRRRILLIAGPVVLLVGALFFYLHGGRVVSSDNAYVHADKLTVSAEIVGTVKQVAVRDNERVAVSQVLFRLDDEPYRIAVAQATAQLDAARLELATLRGNYREKLAALDEAKEQALFADRELKRQETLSATNVATSAELDRARHNADAAQRRIAVLQQDAATTLASLGGRIDQPDDENPRIAAAKTQLEKAERDLRHTVIAAPIAGVVANVANLPVGRLLQPGEPAFTLVATDHVWIEANLKETELTYLKSGDPVRIEVDTYPHHTWSGKVSDIGPATGAEFALIPAQNASGNWVKTVQRIPVRVRIESADPDRPLRAGMSAEVRIDTGHTRSLGDLTRVFGGDDRRG
ncbi:MAG TPA: HlyD family secretion protein [Opitutaceae bacterium]|nr:HlyD family secretion protein [Opitutaceae bacterium]